MARTVFGPDHEPAAWLRELEGQRIAALRAMGLVLDGSIEVVSTLRDPELATSWGRWCSRCQTQVPPGVLMGHLVTSPLPGVVLAGALCPTCTKLERAPVVALAALSADESTTEAS